MGLRLNPTQNLGMLYNMSRDSTEVKLLTIRQRYRDALDFYTSSRVLPLKRVHYLRTQLEVCTELLTLYQNAKLERVKHGKTNQAS
jgi:hypothetical protein